MGLNFTILVRRLAREAVCPADKSFDEDLECLTNIPGNRLYSASLPYQRQFASSLWPVVDKDYVQSDPMELLKQYRRSVNSRLQSGGITSSAQCGLQDNSLLRLMLSYFAIITAYINMCTSQLT